MSVIGSLRHRVTLLDPVRTPDGGGGADIAYEERETVWAAAEDRSTGLSRLAGRYARLVRRRFALRAAVEIGFSTRLAHEGRTFRVTDIRAVSGPKPYQLVTTEEVR